MTVGVELDRASALVRSGPISTWGIKAHWDRTRPRKYLGDLSRRELQVVFGIARGRTQGQIAEDLGIGIQTAKTHTHHALRKTGCHLHAELVSWMYRHGYMGGFKPELNEAPRLTRREQEFIRYLVIGMTNEDIAQRTVTSVGTVKTYVVRIRMKFHAKNRAHLAALAWQVGLAEDCWWTDLGIIAPGPIPTPYDHLPQQWVAPRPHATEENCPNCGHSLTANLTPHTVKGSDGTRYVQDTIW